ncbi:MULTISPECIES: hypothetical protein [unclassified Nocardia]|uniref:hypothetical protein n=1 Tax=unclassified Nocardia TaxID=2637762 RepID=UPI001CE4A4BF|nr:MULTISPECIES: hypothetical protein [unclassified Nocardia]
MPDATEELREVLRRSPFRHRLRTVLHRWYAGYDAPTMPRQYQGELVTDDFTIVRPPQFPVRTVTGRAAYLDSLTTAYTGHRNAHHLRGLELTPDMSHATVTHDFETIGPQLTGTIRMRYDIDLVQDPAGRLPRFHRLTETILGTDDTPFVDGYGENRVRAFIHYWLSLLEEPAATAAPLRELISDELTPRLDEIATRTTAGLGTHHPADLRIDLADPENYRVTMDFEWVGIDASDRPRTARTRHDWTLRESGERYPRLHRYEAEVIEPPTPIPAEDALARALRN